MNTVPPVAAESRGRDERKTDTVYAGKIWNGPVLPVFAGSGGGVSGVVAVHSQRNLVVSHSASDCLLLFPYVFQEYPEAVRGKSEIPADDSGNPKEMGHMEAGYDGAQNTSHL